MLSEITLQISRFPLFYLSRASQAECDYANSQKIIQAFTALKYTKGDMICLVFFPCLYLLQIKNHQWSCNWKVGSPLEFETGPGAYTHAGAKNTKACFCEREVQVLSRLINAWPVTVLGFTELAAGGHLQMLQMQWSSMGWSSLRLSLTLQFKRTLFGGKGHENIGLDERLEVQLLALKKLKRLPKFCFWTWSSWRNWISKVLCHVNLCSHLSNTFLKQFDWLWCFTALVKFSSKRSMRKQIYIKYIYTQTSHLHTCAPTCLTSSRLTSTHLAPTHLRSIDFASIRTRTHTSMHLKDCTFDIAILHLCPEMATEFQQ